MRKTVTRRCQWCGAPFVTNARGRFCRDYHRVRAWRFERATGLKLWDVSAEYEDTRWQDEGYAEQLYEAVSAAEAEGAK